MADSSSDSSSQADSPSKVVSIPSELIDHPQYKVIKRIGKGGMGVLYLVEHRITHRTEALKLIHPHLLSKPGVRERFLREIQTAARLNHPNVVRTLTAISEDNLLGLVMEYAPGETLQRLVYRVGPLSVERALDFILQAAEGLTHAHEEGMVHRDIKPSNLMISQQSDRLRLRILDFGLAKSNYESPEDRQLTRNDTIVGTPEYIAPEQALNPSKADIRADIFGLGCCLYYALTGKVPFEGETTLAVLHANLSGDFKPMTQWRSDIPPIVCQLQEIMMNKDPEKRFQNPKALQNGIRKCFRAIRVQSEHAQSMESNVSVTSDNDTVVNDGSGATVNQAVADGPASSGSTSGSFSENGSPSSTGSLSSQVNDRESPSSESPNRTLPPHSSDSHLPNTSASDSQTGFVLSKSRPLSTSPKASQLTTKKATPPLSQKQKQDRWIIAVAGIALGIMAISGLVWVMLPKKGPTATVLVDAIPSDVEIFINNEKVVWKPSKSSKKLAVEVKPGTIVFSYRRNGEEFRKHQLRLAVNEEHELKADFTATPFGVGENLEVITEPEANTELVPPTM